MNPTLFEVEAADLGHQHAYVAVAPEDGAERVGDLAGRERAGRDLVRERLEEVEVAPIDEREVYRCVRKVLCRLQPTEPSADDNHSMLRSWRGAARAHADVNDATEQGGVDNGL